MTAIFASVRMIEDQFAALVAWNGICADIVTLTYCGLYSAILHEAKPMKSRKAAIDNLARIQSEPG